MNESVPFGAGFEHVPVAIALAVGSLHSFQVELNGRARELFARPDRRKWSGSEWLGCVRRVDGSECPLELQPTCRALRGEVSEMDLVVARGETGEARVRVRAAPVRATDDSVNGAVLVFDDLSTQQELDRQRAQWNALVAHDLRQPINAVHLCADLLRGGLPPGSPLLDIVQKLDAANTRLARLVQEFLDVSLGR